MGSQGSVQSGVQPLFSPDNNSDTMSDNNKIDLSQVPIEILSHILSFVDCKTQVLSCRLVNSIWRDVVETDSLKKRAIMLNTVPKVTHKLPWYVYYACGTGVFKKNLLVNPYGKDNLKGWKPIKGYSSFTIEKPPDGASPIPEEALLDSGINEMEEVGCFATSYTLSAKEQVIELKKHGITSKLMDEIKPNIEISEWFAPRFDCSSIYKLTGELLDTSLNPIQTDMFEVNLEAWTGGDWKQAKLVLQDYPSGGRFVRFMHEGKDSQFWAGEYGSKMTLGKVCFKLPNL